MRHIQQYCSGRLLCLFLVTGLVVLYSSTLTSCSKKSPGNINNYHPGFINAILKKMDTMQNIYADQGFAYIDSFYNTLQNPGIEDAYIKDSIKESKLGFVKHDYQGAIACMDSMLLLIEPVLTEIKYAERRVLLLYLKGDCYFHIKRYQQASALILQAEDASKTVRNRCKIAEYSSLKAYLLYAQEKYSAAAVSFLEQFNSYRCGCDTTSMRNTLTQAAILANVATSYIKAGMTDSAGWYCNTILNMLTGNEYRFPSLAKHTIIERGVIYSMQAEMLEKKGLYRQSEIYYQKSIGCTGQYDPGFTQSSQANLARVYLQENKNTAAGKLLFSLKQSLDTFSQETQIIGWHKLMADYYQKTRQADLAFEHLNQYSLLKDSATARDKKFQDIDFAKEFNTIELKHANTLLQNEATLKNLYLFIAITVVLILAGIAAYVWKSLTRIRRLNQQIEYRNQDLQKALASLEKSHTENSRIIRIVAHDLKSPVNAINNLIYSLLRKDYPADLKEIFGVIKTACSNSMSLVKDLLNNEKDILATRKEMADMKKLLEYCVELLQAKADEKKQRLLLQSENAILMMNGQKIWRVVSNIVNNAIKFSPENSVIDIKLQKREASVLLSVRDSGIGIPASIKEKIFDHLPETSRRGTAGEESYGLGLSISRKIVEEHKGKIWFESEDGKGAVFFVELPCLN